MTGPGTIPVRCTRCRGAVWLQLDYGAPEREPSRAEQVWACPYCLRANRSRLPTALLWAAKRLAGREPGPQ